ncbi:hypothetical protein [Paenibacillus tyrfis]|uniref:hypothetical protein n=1 Tax=Paenibacillus tyrfis TaxID=1501230 RepID=UPI000B594885|nr:hypothetical protein [Paenibacillus tyrfis]
MKDWRVNGAIFIVVKNLEEVDFLLEASVLEEQRIKPILDEYYKVYNDTNTEEAIAQFGRISDRIMTIETSIKYSIYTAILMSVIDLEGIVNCFCFYNGGETVIEAIETLSLSNKIETMHAILGIEKFKGTKPYENLKKIVRWRNSFAHGKNTYASSKSIAKNHTSEYVYKNIEERMIELIEYMNCYIEVLDHLDMINENEGNLTHYDHHCIEEYIKKFKSISYINGSPKEISKIKVADRLMLSSHNFVKHTLDLSRD